MINVPELFTLRVNCLAFVIFTKHFTVTWTHGGLSPPPSPHKLRP